MDFVVRLRNFAPFNALLLQIQKPGLVYAAPSSDWYTRFGRIVKEGVRPLVILWPFGPVAFVYDVADTEGPPLPEGVNPFQSRGAFDGNDLRGYRNRLRLREITWVELDAGQGSAGWIRRDARSLRRKEGWQYTVAINRHHDAPTMFTTLVHELAHLFLGHLGQDAALRVPERRDVLLAQREVEAECVAYLICRRNGVFSDSHRYLADYVEHKDARPEVYQVMRAAGQIEVVLGIGAQTNVKTLPDVIEV